MKQIFRVFGSLILILIICFQTVNACSIVIIPFRKEFKRAKSIFVGKVVNIVEHSPSDTEKSLIPENWRDWKGLSKIAFEVSQKWKGDVSKRQEFIAIAFDDCGCPGGGIDQFKEGEEYLVFATGKNFITVCDSENINSEETKKKMSRLDDFGFRFWAKIFPF